MSTVDSAIWKMPRLLLSDEVKNLVLRPISEHCRNVEAIDPMHLFAVGKTESIPGADCALSGCGIAEKLLSCILDGAVAEEHIQEALISSIEDPDSSASLANSTNVVGHGCRSIMPLLKQSGTLAPAKRRIPHGPAARTGGRDWREPACQHPDTEPGHID